MKIDYQQMVTRKLSAFDVLGHKIHRVRSVEEIEGGIMVTVLHNTTHQNYPVCGKSVGTDIIDGVGVVEFTAEIIGGFIGSSEKFA